VAQNTKPSWPCLPTASFDLFSKDYLLEAAAHVARWMHLRLDVDNDTMLYITYMYGASRAVEEEYRESRKTR